MRPSLMRPSPAADHIANFLETPVTREMVTDILEVASRAPSGTNMQPWKVYVVEGDVKADLSGAILDAHFNHQSAHKSEYSYYPDSFEEPYKSRRRKVGLDLYGLLDIQKGEADKMLVQHGRNYQFFDAPVGLIFAIDVGRNLKIGSWLDYGMFFTKHHGGCQCTWSGDVPTGCFCQIS